MMRLLGLTVLIAAAASAASAAALANDSHEEYRADSDVVVTVRAELEGRQWLADDVPILIRSQEQPLYELRDRSDGEGRVAFRVPAWLAPFEVRAALPGCEGERASILVSESLEERREVSLILPPLLRVVVVDAETKGRLPGSFPVQVLSERGRWTSTPSRSGVGVFGCFAAGEKVRVSALAPVGFEDSEGSVTVSRPVETLRLDLRERPPAVVHPLSLEVAR